MSNLPAFSFASTAEEVATALADNIRGKNVLITGTSLNGLGFETARVSAKYVNLIIITGYNDERLKLSEAAIKKEVPHANIRRLVLNLSSLASVRKAAQVINASPEPLHVVINNAASAWVDFTLTEDGLETQFATAHVGPFLFTKLLAPKLLAARTPTYTPRVVFVASSGHTSGKGVDFDDIAAPDEAKYDKANAYFQAKSANILTAIELSKRSKGAINAYSLHPGVVHTEAQQKEDSIPTLVALGVLHPDRTPNTDYPWKSLHQGAATVVTAAFDPRINDKPGAYLSDSAVANEEIAPHSSDPANAERLWNVTEKIIGERFTFEQ
ncbi:short-chain dehydrogenase [Mycena filopes]|nr:short-chain dehydrogenase [Mycena filopes]